MKRERDYSMEREDCQSDEEVAVVMTGHEQLLRAAGVVGGDDVRVIHGGQRVAAAAGEHRHRGRHRREASQREQHSH